MESIVIAGAVALGSKEVITKLLGPTSEYLGQELQHWAKHRLTNVRGIFAIAEKKLGTRIEEEGGIHPKVLKEILEEGSMNSDPVALEYFGGVLASSRSPVTRDDRGAAMLNVIAALTTYQIRAHYICYLITKRLFNGDLGDHGFIRNVGIVGDRQAMFIYIPISAFAEAMAFGKGETNSQLLPHIFFGLKKHELLETFQFGGDSIMAGIFGANVKEGIVYQPSAHGTELFLWSNALGSIPVESFLAEDVEVGVVADVMIPNDYRKLSEMRK